jgi:hypothetical protein
MTKKRTPQPDVDTVPSDAEDVEGHAMPDPWSAMHLAEAREREIKQAYRRKALEEEARRPHRKEGR